MARFTWVASKPGPPTIALIAPVALSSDTIAASNRPFVSGSSSCLAFSAAACARGSNVVNTFNPPRKRRLYLVW